MSRLLALALLLPAVALADAPWGTSRARQAPEPRVEGLVGTRTLGATWSTPLGGSAVGAEALYAPHDRTFELRGGLQRSLTAPDHWFAASVAAGAGLLFTTAGPFDVGTGPSVSIAVGLGGARASVELGAQAGAELFVRSGGPRFPLRAQLAVGTGVGRARVTLTGRAGADLEARLHPTFRLEAVLALGYALGPAAP